MNTTELDRDEIATVARLNRLGDGDGHLAKDCPHANCSEVHFDALRPDGDLTSVRIRGSLGRMELADLEHVHDWRFAERLQGIDVLLVCGCGELRRATIPDATPKPDASALRGALIAIDRTAKVGVETAMTEDDGARFSWIRDQARAVLDGTE